MRRRPKERLADGSPVRRRSAGPSGGDGARRPDQREVTERLWEVADLALALDVVLLGQEAEVVGQPQQPIKQRTRLPNASVECQCAYEPERAREKLSLIAGKPIVGLGRRIAG